MTITPNFKPFDKVLVRHNNNEVWKADLFSHSFVNNAINHFVTISGISYTNCVAYEGNQLIVGTNKLPDILHPTHAGHTIIPHISSTPCPFCGSTILSVETTKDKLYYIVCTNCGCTGPRTSEDNNTKEEAIKLWNKRIELQNSFNTKIVQHENMAQPSIQPSQQIPYEVNRSTSGNPVYGYSYSTSVIYEDK